MRVAELSSPEFQAVVGTHLMVLPVGAVETHGPHLPLSTDTIIAAYLADRVAEQIEALVLPPLSFGCRANSIRLGGDFPGNIDLGASTLTHHVLDVLTAAHRDGARRFLVVNGAYPNAPFVHDALLTFTRQAPQARVMAVSWWELTSEDLRNAIAEETGVARADDNHAGLVETSLVLHMSPASVRLHLMADDTSRRRARYLVLPTPAELSTRTGVVYRAGQATADIGKRVTEEVVDNLVAAVRLELA